MEGLWGYFTLLILISFLQTVYCLDCYVCHNQDSNDHKCVTSVQNCLQEHDMCMTELSWSTTPYWQAGAKKQFYISKRCARKDECNQVMKKVQFQCTHVWYEDWRCAECCAGDRCNYYVFSGAEKKMWSFSILATCIFITFQAMS